MREYTLALVCRSDDDGGRWLSGIAVPWDKEISLRGRKESFAPGGMRASDSVIPLRYGHQSHPEGYPMPIGQVVETVDTEAGLWMEARMVDSQAADHAYELAAEGIVRGLSVEFDRSGGLRGSGAQGRVTDGRLTGVVLTERPLYASAGVTAVRARTARLDEWLAWRDSLTA